MRSMEAYPRAAMERATKVQDVMLQAMAKTITWWQAAEILGGPTAASRLIQERKLGTRVRTQSGRGTSDAQVIERSNTCLLTVNVLGFTCPSFTAFTVQRLCCRCCLCGRPGIFHAMISIRR